MALLTTFSSVRSSSSSLFRDARMDVRQTNAVGDVAGEPVEIRLDAMEAQVEAFLGRRLLRLHEVLAVVQSLVIEAAHELRDAARVGLRERLARTEGPRPDVPDVR